VLTHDAWIQRFGADERVLGRMIDIGGRPVQIVGVLPEGAELPNAKTDLWVPLELDPAAPPINAHYLSTIARLRDGASPEAAERDSPHWSGGSRRSCLLHIPPRSCVTRASVCACCPFVST